MAYDLLSDETLGTWNDWGRVLFVDLVPGIGNFMSISFRRPRFELLSGI